jgi:hypothetical protein
MRDSIIPSHMGFRIALGRCSCEKPHRDPLQAGLCEAIDSRIADWMTRLPADLAAVPNEAYEEDLVDGQPIAFAIHKQLLQSGDTLIVFQAMVRTWAHPNFISLSAVGRMYAEGILVSAAGAVERAPDAVMWEFR